MIIILREGQSTTTSCRPVDRDFLILNTSNPWHLHNVNHKNFKSREGELFFLRMLFVPHWLGSCSLLFFKLLCSDYARSKRCISSAVQKGCAIGDLMEDDLYNPFCIDGIDPLSLPSTSRESIHYF